MYSTVLNFRKLPIIASVLLKVSGLERAFSKNEMNPFSHHSSKSFYLFWAFSRTRRRLLSALQLDHTTSSCVLYLSEVLKKQLPSEV